MTTTKKPCANRAHQIFLSVPRGFVAMKSSIFPSDIKNLRGMPGKVYSFLMPSLKSVLKSSIIWFPTHGLMSIKTGDRLISFFKLRAA